MEDLLQPRTDAGVLLQVVVVAIAVTAAAWRVRRRPDLLRLVVGSGLVLAGLFVLRAMH